MDAKPHTECFVERTMVRSIAIGHRRYSDERQSVYTTRLRCVCWTGRRQEKYLGDLYQSPRIHPNDVLIDILHCGVCHSDIHQVRGDWGDAVFPMVPGHEIIGIVA